MNRLSLREPPTFLERPTLVFLILLWGLGIFILALPFANSFSFLQKVRYLAPAAIVSVIMVLLNTKDGLAFWALGLTLLVMGTGYQFEIGSVRTSALEVLLVFLIFLLIWNQRSQGTFRKWELHLPGQGWLLGFVLFSAAIFVLSLLRGIPLTRAVIQFKGFILYPFFAYILVAGIQTRRILHGAVILVLVMALIIAGVGMADFAANYTSPHHPQAVFRSSGRYGPQNLFGLTLAAIALLIAAWGLGQKKSLARILLLMAVLWIMAGAMTSISRTMGAAFFVGILYLLSLRGIRKSYPVILIAVGVALLLLTLFPHTVSARLFQLTDTSFQARTANVELGLRVVMTYPWGTGWGQGYTQRMGELVPSGFIPWHHNDYLNLAVQTGVLGLGIYLIFWAKVILNVRRWLKENKSPSSFIPIVQGAQAALVALLVGAVFEHVLWRPDIAGLVGWTLGIMVAAMRLHECDRGQSDA